MAEPAKLLRCDVRAVGTAFCLRLETDRGETIEVMATQEQLDLLADILDDALLDGASPERDQD